MKRDDKLIESGEYQPTQPNSSDIEETMKEKLKRDTQNEEDKEDQKGENPVT